MKIGADAANLVAPAWAAGRYYALPEGATLSTSAGLGVGTMRALPFYVPNQITITRLGSEISAVGEAGSKLRLGIYADDGTGRPGSLLLDAGTINGDSATVQEIAGLSLSLGPGWYWAVGCVQVVTTTQPTVRSVTAHPNPVYFASIPTAAGTAVGFVQNGVTGAFPATFTVGSTTATTVRIFART